MVSYTETVEGAKSALKSILPRKGERGFVRELAGFYCSHGDTAGDAVVALIQEDYAGLRNADLSEFNMAESLGRMKREYPLMSAGFSEHEISKLTDLKGKYKRGLVRKG